MFAKAKYFVIFFALILACANKPHTVKSVMDDVVSRLYRDFDEQELLSLNDEKVQKFITPSERKILATRYWYFNVNVPVTVSVMRHNEQAVVPFW
ncbi:MAG: metallophosphoesterase, partial [Promethearchaeota archaeon]